jgi:hypothetical protein
MSQKNEHPSAMHAITEFFARERQKLIWYVRRLIVDSAERDAEDIVQDVAAGILYRADVAVPLENVTAFVYRSLSNRVIDYLRKRKSHTSLDSEIIEGLTLLDVLEDAKSDVHALREQNDGKLMEDTGIGNITIRIGKKKESQPSKHMSVKYRAIKNKKYSENLQGHRISCPCKFISAPVPEQFLEFSVLVLQLPTGADPHK